MFACRDSSFLNNLSESEKTSRLGFKNKLISGNFSQFLSIF